MLTKQSLLYVHMHSTIHPVQYLVFHPGGGGGGRGGGESIYMIY